jgi:tetratricopeptide (TPR) repeat protein
MTNLAWAYIQVGETQNAFNTMEIFIANIDTSSSFQSVEDQIQAFANSGAIHALAFDFDIAIQNLDAAIQLAETNHIPNETIARLYKQRGDHIFLIYEWDRVLADYNRAIELDHDFADAYYARGVLYYTQGPRTAALENFLKFSELAPNNEKISEVQIYISSITAELDALDGDDIETFSEED